MAGTIVVPAFWRVEWCHAGPDRTSRSGAIPENAWTHIQTNTSGQLFFTDPPVEIFVHRTFNAKAFERSFTTILDKQNMEATLEYLVVPLTFAHDRTISYVIFKICVLIHDQLTMVYVCTYMVI